MVTVPNVKAFKRLDDKLRIPKTIDRGERAIEEGRVISHKRAKQRMAQWLHWPGEKETPRAE